MRDDANDSDPVVVGVGRFTWKPQQEDISNAKEPRIDPVFLGFGGPLHHALDHRPERKSLALSTHIYQRQHTFGSTFLAAAQNSLSF